MKDPYPPDMARTVITNPHRHEFLIGDAQSRTVVVSMSGEPHGPVIAENVTGMHVALLTSAPIVVFGRYYQGKLRAYNWLTGELLWEASGFREIGTLNCHSSSKVLVLLLGGVCSVVDGETGRVLEHTSHVECVAGEPDSSRMVLLRRGRKSPRGSAKMLEYRTSLRGEPEFSVPCDLEWFDHVPIGRGWIAVAETRIGGKLLVVDFSGRVLWRHQLPIEDNFWCCMAAPDQLALLIIVRDQSSPSLDPKSRRPDRVVLFEGMTGRVLKSADFPSLSLGREPAMHGAVVIGFDGILHVPSLEFEPRDFRVRAKGG